MRLGLVVALAAACLAPRADAADLVGSIVWEGEGREGFGGFSSIDLGPGGSFVATSDGGSIATGRLIREGEVLTGVETDFFGRLQDHNGDPLPLYYTDAEGVALAPDGTIYVSFEARHRVTAYPAPDGPSAPFPQPAEFDAMQNNSSLEALAIDDTGALFTLPERSGELTRPFPVFRYKDGTWDQPFALRRDGDFLPVGADFGPDGKLYLLERTNVLITFATRVRRFGIEGERVVSEETVLETPLGTHGDLEGIAVWRDAGGDIRLTMIADDNFKPFFATDIVEYALTE